jgi:hypothetical protein
VALSIEWSAAKASGETFEQSSSLVLRLVEPFGVEQRATATRAGGTALQLRLTNRLAAAIRLSGHSLCVRRVAADNDDDDDDNTLIDDAVAHDANTTLHGTLLPPRATIALAFLLKPKTPLNAIGDLAIQYQYADNHDSDDATLEFSTKLVSLIAPSPLMRVEMHSDACVNGATVDECVVVDVKISLLDDADEHQGEKTPRTAQLELVVEPALWLVVGFARRRITFTDRYAHAQN